MKYGETNKPLVCMQTQSTCYKGTTTMEVKGVLWHSTGANNPTIKRYVQPSDNDPDKAALLNLIGKNTYGNDWNHIDHQAGLNCWIGKLADGTVATVQTMPWNYRPWGCGSGSKGSCNTGWVQFEICEDGLTDPDYFNKVYQEACEITAYLCKLYNIDPHGTVTVNGVKIPTILCHQDSYKLGFGSNHGDVLHWFPKFGKSMATARDDVAALISSSANTAAESYTKIMGGSKATAAQMKAYILSIKPDVAQSVLDMIPLYLSEGDAEGVRGDVAFAQSCLETGNFGFAGSAVTLDQNNFCGMGVTSNGVKGNSFDTPQLGIRAQIQHLKAYASTEGLKNAVIDPRFQYVTRGCAQYVEWLGQQENPNGKGWAAGAGYGSKILTILAKIVGTKETADSAPATPAAGLYRVRKTWADASSQIGAFAVLDNAKACADKNTGYTVFDESGTAVYPVTQSAPSGNVPYQVKVSIADLNIRKGAGTNYATTGKYTGIGVFTIVEEKSGQGSTKGWGKLKSGAGWISLDYATKVA